MQYEPKYGAVVILLVDSHVTEGVNEKVRRGRQGAPPAPVLRCQGLPQAEEGGIGCGWPPVASG